MGCCVDRASADPGEFQSWGCPLEPEDTRPLHPTSICHWMQAPWEMVAAGKAMVIELMLRAFPAAGGISFIAGST